MQTAPSIYPTGTRWIRTIADALLPRHCVACGLISGDNNLCQPCQTELPRISHGCAVCGIRLSLTSDLHCGSCLRNPPAWGSGVMALDYRFPVDQLICRFKFSRDFACGHILAQELLTTIEQRGAPLPDAIVPVPLHRWRLFRRSFNQAEYLARKLGKGLGLAVYGNLLARSRSTRAQSGLDSIQRRKNLQGAFRSQRRVIDHVALVDDVLTTGATLSECTRTLLHAGVGKVSVWAAARAHVGGRSGNPP